MSSIFTSHPFQNGYTWTITSKIGHILQEAEKRFGERDKSYSILGVEFNQDGHPRIWYPGDCKNIVIQISLSCINDLNRAVFQVSHELIHCLSPTGIKSANCLEEGLANLFSIEYTRDNRHGIWTSSDPKYTAASKLVEELFAIDNDIIKKVRNIIPTISLIDKETLIKANSSIPEELAEKLTVKF
jgi:hypothetical protein